MVKLMRKGMLFQNTCLYPNFRKILVFGEDNWYEVKFKEVDKRRIESCTFLQIDIA